jgi:hypothetical protein
MSLWETHEDSLRDCINRGLSADDTANVITRLAGETVTRNACLGAAHRRGWGFGRPVPPAAVKSAPVAADKPPEPPQVAPPETAGPDTPDAIALSLLCEHRIVQKALEPFVERVLASPDLYAAVARQMLEAQCRRILEGQIAAKHAAEKRKTGGGPLGAQRGANLAEWAGAVEQALMDGFRLPNGRKLGDATRPDLALAMGAYEIQSTDAAIKHRWLRLILQSVPAGKTVRETLTEERLAELRESARKADA